MFLPSTACLNLYPENSASNWITTLNPPLLLQGDWSVGLSEIHVPSKWSSITTSNNDFLVSFGDIKRTMVKQTVPATPNQVLSSYNRTNNQSGKIPALQPPPSYAAIPREKAITVTLMFDPHQFYTRETFLNRFQMLLELFATEKLKDVELGDNIKIEYKSVTFENTNIFIYEISFVNGWKILFDANSLEPQHLIISRFLGCLPCSIFHPLSKTIFVNKYDNLNGEISEYKAKLSELKMYIYNNDSFDATNFLAIRNRKLMSMEIVNQICKIPEGNYSSPKHLVSAMMHALPKQLINFLSLSVTDAGHLKITSFNYRYFNILFYIEKRALGSMLGLHESEELGVYLPESREILRDSTLQIPDDVYGFGQIGQFIAKNPIDIYRGIYGFYVYCDLIEPQYTGDTKTNLLRVIPTNVDNITVFNFSNVPQYKTICMQYITKIQIVIKTDTDEEINFVSSGKTLCKLHFKKIKN